MCIFIEYVTHFDLPYNHTNNLFLLVLRYCNLPSPFVQVSDLQWVSDFLLLVESDSILVWQLLHRYHYIKTITMFKLLSNVKTSEIKNSNEIIMIIINPMLLPHTSDKELTPFYLHTHLLTHKKINIQNKNFKSPSTLDFPRFSSTLVGQYG